MERFGDAWKHRFDTRPQLDNNDAIARRPLRNPIAQQRYSIGGPNGESTAELRAEMPQGFERPAASPRPDGHHGGTVQGELGHDHFYMPPRSAGAIRTDKKGD